MEEAVAQLVIHDDSADGNVVVLFTQFLDMVMEIKKRKSALKLLEKISKRDNYEAVIIQMLEENYLCKDISFLKKVSSLLELSAMTRKLIENLFVKHLTFLSEVFFILMDQDKSEEIFKDTESYNAASILLMKVSLQTMQFLPERVKAALVMDHEKVLLEQIMSSMLNLMCDKKYSKECSLLCGKTFALLFQLMSHESILPGVWQLVKNVDTLASKQLQLHHLMIECPKSVSSVYVQLCLINGLTSTSCSLLILPNKDGRLLLEEVFDLLLEKCLLIPDAAAKYLCCQTICSWLNQLQIISLDNVLKHSKEETLFLGKHSKFMGPLLDVVRNNIEDLVDGVPYLIQQMFSMMLKLHETEKKLKNCFESKFLEDLLMDVFSQAWYVKGRWAMLVELVPYFGTMKLTQIHQGLVAEMLSCLKTCSLPAISNEVYRCLLNDTKKRADSMDVALKEWSEVFLNSIIKGFQDDNMLIQQNVGQYWIPSTFQILPGTEKVLESLLSELLVHHSQLLHAYILVLKNARSSGLMNSAEMEKRSDLLADALKHADMHIRAETLSLLCYNPKKTEPFPLRFQMMVLDFVENNINHDSSKFRQQLFSALKRLLMNVRESCVVLHRKVLKRPCKEEQLILDNLIDFVEAILILSKSCLHPSALYQRKKAGLQLIGLLSDLFVFVKDKTKRKKGAAEEIILPLLKYVADKNPTLKKWHILSAVNEELLCCIEDQHDEIRDLALNILTYQQSIMDEDMLLDVSTFEFLLKVAKNLLESPRYHETESGATLVHFLLQSTHKTPSFMKCVKADHTTTVETHGWMALCYYILHEAQKSLKDAKTDFLLAACEKPIYGYSMALSQCFKALQTFQVDVEVIRKFSKEVLDFADSSTETMVKLLAGTYHVHENTADSPSFADIDGALDGVLLASPSYKNLGKSIGHLHCRELLMSLCWLNLKAVCFVVTEIGNLVARKSNQSLLLDVDDIAGIFKFYTSTLIGCRHKGVIEASHASLACFTKAGSNIPMYWDMLKRVCKEVMLSTTDVKRHGSVTKRSAGIPMFVQAIISAEPTCQSYDLLQFCMNHLFKTTRAPLPTNLEVTYDLPQFNAINILRTIFRDNSLGNAVLPYVEEGVMLTIDGFSSPSWSVRNASTLLLGTLVPRTLGQRISQEENSQQNASTVDVFFNRYPKLLMYFLTCLRKQSCEMEKDGANCILPHVVPILTFLSKLRSSGSEQFKRTSQLYLPVLNGLRSSSVFTIRDLTAKSIVSFTCKADYMSLAESLICSLPCIVNNNILHTSMLIIRNLLNYSEETKKSLSYLLFEKISCFDILAHKLNNLMATSMFIDVLLQSTMCIDSSESAATLYNQVFQIAANLKSVLNVVGKTFLEKSLSKAVVCLLKNNHITRSAELLHMVKNSSLVEFNTYFFTFIQDVFQFLNNDVKAYLFTFTIDIIYNATNRNLLQAALQAFMKFASSSDCLMKEVDITSLYQKIADLSKQHFGLLLALIPVMGSIWKFTLKENLEFSNTDIDYLTKLIQSYSEPENSEDLRLAVAETLGILQYFLGKTSDGENNLVILRLLNASLNLLQDEDELIRMEANNSLQFLNGTTFPCQTNITLKNLFKTVQQHESIFHQWIMGCLDEKKDKDNTSELMLFEQESANLYAEEMQIINLACEALINIFTCKEGKKDHFSHSRDAVNSTCSGLLEEIIEAETSVRFKKIRSVYGLFGNKRYFMKMYKLLKMLQVLQVLSSNESVMDHMIKLATEMLTKNPIPAILKDLLKQLSEKAKLKEENYAAGSVLEGTS